MLRTTMKIRRLDESTSLHSRRLILIFSANQISRFEKWREIFLPLRKGGFPPLKKGGFYLKSPPAGALSPSALPWGGENKVILAQKRIPFLFHIENHSQFQAKVSLRETFA